MAVQVAQNALIEFKQILSDEKGKLSAARTLLVGSLLFTGALILFDIVLWGDVSNAIYALLGTIFTGLLAWAAGPRIAQYLAPQIGAVASGISASIQREPRRPTVLDNSSNFHDDEA